MQWLLLILIIPYLLLLLKIYTDLVKTQPFYYEKYDQLYVSVIVACHNEEKKLPLLLEDLSEQDYNPDLFEVLIIDDNSSDRTCECVSGFTKIKNIRLLKNAGTGKKYAIKTGVNASSGNVIITTDADCRMGSRWLSSITSFCTREKPDMIICPVNTESNQDLPGSILELEFLSLQGITAGTAISGNPVMCNGANLAFTRESYIRNSDNLHFDLVSGDDVFLLHAIKKDPESKILWLESQDATVTTTLPETLMSFLGQRARWISKAGVYKDPFTKILTIVTFVTILVQLSALTAGFFDLVFFTVFGVSLLMKAVPDYLILRNTCLRYGKRSLMKAFVPAEIIYPFYIVSVLLYYLVNRKDFSPSLN